MVSPFGDGFTIGAINSDQQYDDTMRDLAMAVADSVEYAVPKESQKTWEWRDWFKGKRLT